MGENVGEDFNLFLCCKFEIVQGSSYFWVKIKKNKELSCWTTGKPAQLYSSQNLRKKLKIDPPYVRQHEYRSMWLEPCVHNRVCRNMFAETCVQNHECRIMCAESCVQNHVCRIMSAE